MPENVTIKLSAPIQTHQGFVSEINFRPPTLGEYLAIGELVTLVRSPNGNVIPTDNNENYSRYIEKLLLPPVQALQIEDCSLEVALEVKDIIANFFQTASLARERSKKSQTTSSSEQTDSSTSSTSKQ